MEGCYDSDYYFAGDAQMITRCTQITILPEGKPIFSEEAFVIQIEVEAGGEYLSIQSNQMHLKSGEIRIDKNEWTAS
jgi:hypothetical protein